MSGPAGPASEGGSGCRIVLIHHSVPPVVGGVERVIGHHARLLSRQGHRVSVVAGRGAMSGGVRFIHEPLVDSLHPEVLRIGDSLAGGTVPPAFHEVRGRLIEALRPVVRSADLVIAHNIASLHLNLPLTAALADLCDEAAGGRFVLWHHDLAWRMDRHRPSLHDGHPWDLLRTPWPHAAHVTISRARRRDLVELTGIPESDITVVPDGVDVPGMLSLDQRTVALARSIPMLDADPLLLMPARVVPRKNIETALLAVEALTRLGAAPGLVVTGPVDPHDPVEREHLDRLLALRHELGLDDRVWFPGVADDRGLAEAVVADLYGLADVLLLPSRDEGFGIPLLEALLYRLPIVCSDLPALREIGGDALTYVDPDADGPQVAAAVRRVLDDPVRRLERSIRRERSWEVVGRDHLAPLVARLATLPPVG